MNKRILSIVACILFSHTSLANDDVRPALERMFEVTDMQAMLNASYAQLDQVFAQMSQANQVKEKDKAIYEKHRKKFLKEIKNTLSWDNIKEPIINAYSKVYSKQEVEELITFYQSPLGQKMLKKMPELMQVTMQVVQQTSRKMIPRMQALQAELKKELAESAE